MGAIKLQLRDVTKVFHRGLPTETIALNAVNLDISTGDFLIIVGPNGAGKSCLLNVIAGTIRADSGSISLNGESINDLLDFQRNRWISFVRQDPMRGTAPDLTIIDNLRLAWLRTQKKSLRIGTDKAFRQQMRTWLKNLELDLENRLDMPVRNLSGGQRQALTLIMAVLQPPELLLLDEPVAALDPRSSETVLSLSQQLIEQQSLTALMVTHNLRHALQYGNKLLIMEHGAVSRLFNEEEKSRLTFDELQRWFLTA